MSPTECREMLTEALHLYDDENPGEIKRVASYADEGMMTLDEVLVITMADGSEFQVRVLRGR